jgi:hypothetical protein
LWLLKILWEKILCWKFYEKNFFVENFVFFNFFPDLFSFVTKTELHQNSTVWLDVVGDISLHSNEATTGQPSFIFQPFEEVQLNLTFQTDQLVNGDLTARFLFCSEPIGGDKEPICILNATIIRPKTHDVSLIIILGIR